MAPCKVDKQVSRARLSGQRAWKKWLGFCLFSCGRGKRGANCESARGRGIIFPCDSPELEALRNILVISRFSTP